MISKVVIRMAFKDKSADNAYKNSWQRANKDRILLLLDKDIGTQIRQQAAAEGTTLTKYIIKLITTNRL